MNAYSAGENDAIDSVAWVDEPTLGKAIAIAGLSNSFSEGLNNQAWVALVDPGGDYIWSNLYGITQFDYATSISPVFGPAGELKSLAVAGSHDLGGHAWIMEIESSDGTPSWQCQYEQFNFINSFVPTGDGQFVFISTINAPEPALAIVKTDRSSTNPCGLGLARVWGEEDPSWDSAYEVKVTADGGFVVAGLTTLYGASRGIIFKFNEELEPEWQSTVASDELHPVDFFDVIEVFDEAGEPDGFLAVGSFGLTGMDVVIVLARFAPNDGSERWIR